MIRWYRRSRGQDQVISPKVRLENCRDTTLLIRWATVVILLVGDSSKINTPRPNELLVEAFASQCSWTFDYDNWVYRSMELVLASQSGERFVLRITSLDEPDTFFVPGLNWRGKARLERWTTLTVTPKEIDDYPVTGDTTCVNASASGTAKVRVVEPMAFQSWLVMQAPSERPALAVSQVEKGQQLAEVSGCLGCHSTDGSEIAGPTLQSLYGKQRKLEDGSLVLAEDEYIRMAIREPENRSTAGFPNIMPAAYTMFTDDEIRQLLPLSRV